MAAVRIAVYHAAQFCPSGASRWQLCDPRSSLKRHAVLLLLLLLLLLLQEH